MKTEMTAYLTEQQLHDIFKLGPNDVIYGDHLSMKWSVTKQKWVITAIVGDA